MMWARTRLAFAYSVVGQSASSGVEREMTPTGDRMEFDRNHDARVREAAFGWLAEQVLVQGDVLPRTTLAQGFTFAGQRVPFLGPQGIFKPAAMQLPLSITTSPNTRYRDTFGPDNLLSYSYRGTDPLHRDNVGLRFVMLNGLPLAYLHGIVPGLYLAFWPVYVVQDRPELLTFSVAMDDAVHIDLMSRFELNVDQRTEIRREYITSQAKIRLHQRMFRERVLRAYRHQCAFAGCGTASCSMPPTSCPMRSRRGNRSYPTGSPYAACITPPSTTSSWVSAPT